MTAMLILCAMGMQGDKAEIEQLKKRVEELEKKQAERDPVSWSEIVLGTSKIRFYGFLRLDVIVDDSRTDIVPASATGGLIGFVYAEDDDHPVAANRAESDDDQIFIHPRLTRLGMDFDGPTIGLLGDAAVTGKLEIDFYNGGSESREIPRLRHAYGKLTWDHGSFLFGQTADLIAPVFPVVNGDFVMWGAGNLGDRRPQVRIDVWTDGAGGRFFVQAMVGLTGAQDGALSGAFADFAGAASGLPTVQNRIAYRVELWPKQNLEIGFWSHHAWEKTDARIAGENLFFSQAAGVDLAFPVYEDVVWFKGEIWTGRNLDDVRGGIFQGVNARGHEIRSNGGFAEIGFKPARWITLHGGYATDDPSNAEIPANGREQNVIVYGAIRLNADPIEIGLEFMHWMTRWDNSANGDSDVGIDKRWVVYFAYKF